MQKGYVFIMVLLLGSCRPGPGEYSQKYCFDFKSTPDYNWSLNYCYRNVRIDSVFRDGGWYLNRFSAYRPLADTSFAVPLDMDVSQEIVLPDVSMKEIRVDWTGSDYALEKALFYLSAFDRRGCLLATDSVSILAGDKESHTFSCSLPAKNAFQLKIGIRAVGTTDPEHHLESERVAVRIDGKEIDRFPLNPGLPAGIRRKDAVPLFSDTAVFRLDIPAGTAVFALGENMHGSRTLNRIGLEWIRSEIAAGTCKLVLFEMPGIRLLKWNRFVQTDLSLTQETFSEEFADCAFSVDELYRFLSWVKAYNRTAGRKVAIGGMEVDFNSRESYLYLSDYLQYVDREAKNARLTECYRFSNKKEYLSRLALVLDTLYPGGLPLSPNEYKTLRCFLQSQLEVARLEPLRDAAYALRDSFMAVHVRYLQQLWCGPGGTAAIYSHIEHAGRQQVGADRRYRSLGKILQDTYGSRYFAVGLWGGRGEVMRRIGSVSDTVVPLKAPPAGSVEAVFDEAEAPFYYASAALFPDHLVLARSLGSMYAIRSPFVYQPFRNRMDGWLYVREVAPFRNPLSDRKERIWHQLERIYGRGNVSE